MSSGVGADGFVMGLAKLLISFGKGLLEWSVGLGKGLHCGVGMQLVDGVSCLQGCSLMWLGAVV